MSSVDLDYDELFLKSDYVDSCQHTTFNKKRKEIFLINIRSLQKHIDELNSVLASFKNQPEIVAISENKIIEGKINRNINLDGYNFIHCGSVTRAGGVGLYIKNTLAYKIDEHSKAELTNAEHLWVEIQTKQEFFVVVVVYKHPDENAVSIVRFNDEFNELLMSLNYEKKEFYCVRDFNIDLIKITNKEAVRRYANMLLSCNCQCLIDVPNEVTLARTRLLTIFILTLKKSHYSQECSLIQI